MKRKLDPNKIYKFIGQAVVYSSLYIGSIAFFYWAFLQRINLLILKERSWKEYERINFNNFSFRSQFKNLKLVHNITRGDMHEYRNN